MERVKPEQMTDKELVAEKGNQFLCDVESYPNYFCVCFESVQTGRRVYFEGTKFNRNKFKWLLNNCTVVSFNGLSYDIHMMIIALLKPEFTEHDLFRVTEELIVHNVKPYKVYQAHGINDREAGVIDHIDLINVAFGKASLKLYAGRLHAPYMQDLPYEPGTTLNEDEKLNVLWYCFNDLVNTGWLRKDLHKQLALRETMSAEYGVDLRSKSDAQVAEAVIQSEILKRTGMRAKRPEFNPEQTFKYEAPAFISFQTEQLQRVLREVQELDFGVQEKSGNSITPNYFEKLKITMGRSAYKMGSGGLHSSESCKTYVSTAEVKYIDQDVASYYPRLILNSGYYPEQLGPVFLEIFEDIVERRLKAKREKDKVTDASLKVTINGTFGKLGSRWSIMYAPKLMIQVTVTGQLSLLMLIERLELAGFSVISANTDGLVTEVPTARRAEYDAICKQWEHDTQFELEANEYKALYSRDVNNYIAVSEGYTKRKGTYRPADISKNPQGEIISDAVVAFLETETPVEDTIKVCTDPRKFIFVQTVKGGAVKDGEFVGKVVRWYHKKGDYTALRYKGSGNKVPKSDGGNPIMELGDQLPSDIDYDFYIRMAKASINQDFHKKEQLSLFDL